MTLTVELPDALEAVLKTQAMAHGISAANYVLEQALAPAAEQRLKPKKSAYGLLAEYGPGPTEKEIDENRKEMFRGFGEDVP